MIRDKLFGMLADTRGQGGSVGRIVGVVVALAIGLYVAGALFLPALEWFQLEDEEGESIYDIPEDVEAIVELVPILAGLALAVAFLVVVMRNINDAT